MEAREQFEEVVQEKDEMIQRLTASVIEKSNLIQQIQIQNDEMKT